MAVESKTPDQIVLGRAVVPSKQEPYTIGDQINRITTWRDNIRAPQPKVRLQEAIDNLTEAGENLGMDFSYLDYFSEKNGR